MLTTEDFIDIITVAANLRGKPRRASALAFHCRFYYSANMYGFEVFHKKKRKPFRFKCLLPCRGTPTFVSNKHETAHAFKREPLVTHSDT